MTNEQGAGDDESPDEDAAEDTSFSELIDTPPVPVQARDDNDHEIPEDESHIQAYDVPEDTPLARVEIPSIQLRRWVVAGLGGLVGLVLLISPLMILVEPELLAFATSYLQTALAGLFGIGGTVVAYLFTRDPS